ncbi:MAG: protein phosphatase 2C domain-containing protein [Myxococcota bacterium]|nr:protein phosphatase 2C domain-containing protein [Myxococcota bacterium]
MTPLYIHGLKDVGQQRERNEDDYRIEPRGAEGWLLVVCDGMGGHGGGHIASAVACETITDQLPAAPLPEPPRDIYESLRTANIAVHRHAETSADPAMGTTAVIAWIEGTRCWSGWVGDSRLYRFRAGKIMDQTVDHTRVQAMVELGILSEKQAKNHPDAHILTQAIGGGERSDVKPSVWNEPMDLEPGDVLLMCSDGLYDLIRDEELYPMISGKHYQAAVETLVAEANRRGGVDNITVVVCVVGQPDVPAAEPLRRRPPILPILAALLALGLGVFLVVGLASGAGFLLTRQVAESVELADTSTPEVTPDATPERASEPAIAPAPEEPAG